MWGNHLERLTQWIIELAFGEVLDDTYLKEKEVLNDKVVGIWGLKIRKKLVN